MKIICIVIFFLISCSNRKTENKNFTYEIPTEKISSVSGKSEDPNELFIIYLDSVKKFETGMAIPHFLYNHFFDYEHPWLTDHHTWSIRKMIFDSTANLNLLKAIVNSNDVRFKKIVDSNSVSDKTLLSAIPYTNNSNYEMALTRLTELKAR